MGDGLVCEFAYIRQEETESYEVNSFPFGQTQVGSANLYFRCLAATEEKRLKGDCLRVANIKLKGGQYYSLTALIPVDESPGNQKVHNHATRGCQKLLQTVKPGAYHYEPGKHTTNKSYYQGKKLPIVLPIDVP